MRRTIQRLVLVLPMLVAGRPAWADDAYRQEVEAWRLAHETKLKAEDGWLTLAGLHWLESGRLRVGSGRDNAIRLPDHAPALVGVLELDADRATFRAEPGVGATIGGRAFTEGELRTDAAGKPDVLAVGPVRLVVIRRGERYALRVKDNLSPVRAGFRGLRWFPVDEAWRVRGRFEPAKTSSKIVMETVVGTRDSFESPGVVVFERDGNEYRLKAAIEDEKLWIVFRDATAGRTTSGNARQLLADPPGADGTVTLDFNRAVNLPCAYTPYATCPVAPRENRLDMAIPAGEQLYESSPRE